jgi:hypothetical protein
MYALKLAIFAVGAVLAWLWWRSEHGRLSRARWVDPAARKRVWVVALLIALANVFALPVLYRVLTRREAFTATTLDLALAGAACAAALAAALAALTLLRGASGRAWLHATACVALVLAVPVPASIWYDRVERPRLEAAGVPEYDEAAYTWKHAHEWPTQTRIVLEGMLPALLMGRDTQLEHDPKATWPWGWKGVLSVAFLAGLALAVNRKAREQGWRSTFGERDFVLIAPFLATLAVMLPSWLLFSDYSFRYVFPFLPGMYLLLYRCVELPIRKHRHGAAAFLAMYLIYCAVDAWRFTAW